MLFQSYSSFFRRASCDVFFKRFVQSQSCLELSFMQKCGRIMCCPYFFIYFSSSKAYFSICLDCLRILQTNVGVLTFCSRHLSESNSTGNFTVKGSKNKLILARVISYVIGNLHLRSRNFYS